jgi:RNA polymerase sigma-54 factor
LLVGLDISTISRVANSKYVETPGTKLIKVLLRSDENDQGEDVSTLEIKKILQNIIEEEDKKTTTRRSTCGIVKRKRIPHCEKNHR